MPVTELRTVLEEIAAYDGQEVDLLARYVERLLSNGPGDRGSGLSEGKLRKYGYIQE